MNNYFNADIAKSLISAIPNSIEILPQNDIKLYSQTKDRHSATKVGDMQYVPTDKITVHKYRLYKAKETL